MKIFATICLFLTWAHIQADPIRIVLVGDSLLSASVHHEATGKYGWGEFFGDFFSEEVEVINRGKGGQSTKSFIEAGFWEQALAFQGDYYFIEFGHNDQKEGFDFLFTEPEGEYSENLRKFVFEILLQGGKPIFITPLTRRIFITEDSVNANLLPYVHAMKQVAEDWSVPVIDMYSVSKGLYEAIGEEQSRFYAPFSEKDKTHFGLNGSIWCARWISSEVLWSDHPTFSELKEFVSFEIPNQVFDVPASLLQMQVSTTCCEWKPHGEAFYHAGGDLRVPVWLEHSDTAFARVVYAAPEPIAATALAEELIDSSSMLGGTSVDRLWWFWLWLAYQG